MQLNQLALAASLLCAVQAQAQSAPDLIISNGKVATMTKEGRLRAGPGHQGRQDPGGRQQRQHLKLKGAGTQLIDAGGKTVIPRPERLPPAHHPRRLELQRRAALGRRDVAEAGAANAQGAGRAHAGRRLDQGGGRLERIPVRRKTPADAGGNQRGGADKPVFLLYLYGLGFLNQKGVATLGYNADTKFKDGVVELGADGKPAGLLIAKPNAMILYTTLAKTNALPREQQLNSTQQYYTELNRLGLTSAIDGRRRRAGLSRRLRGQPGAGQERQADRAHLLLPVRAKARQGAGRLPALADADQAGPQRPPVLRQRLQHRGWRREPGVERGRLRKLPGAAARHAAADGERTGAGAAPADQETAGRSASTPPTTRA